MDFYAELIEARQSKNPEHRLQLLDYEKRKTFELRISELEAFIREHELTTQAKRDALSGLGNKYQPQVSVLTRCLDVPQCNDQRGLLRDFENLML